MGIQGVWFRLSIRCEGAMNLRIFIAEVLYLGRYNLDFEAGYQGRRIDIMKIVVEAGVGCETTPLNYPTKKITCVGCVGIMNVNSRGTSLWGKLYG